MFSKVSSVSLVGGCPTGMGIDIVTTGSICCDTDVAMFSARELDKYFLFQISQGVYAVI